jgi:hydrogenase/urease accessory protein HupE
MRAHLNPRRWPRILSGLVAGLLGAHVLGTTLAAHDMWIEPTSFTPKAGEIIGARLRVGQDFIGDPLRRDDALIDQFIVQATAGRTPLIGRIGADPAGLLRVDGSGVLVIGYQSHPSAVVQTTEKFNQYLKEEGLEATAALRARRGQTGDVRERFSRCAKSLVLSGTTKSAEGDRALGFTLEGDEVSRPMALDTLVVPPSRATVAWTYPALGFTHIIPKGLDHILFVLGIFLLSRRLRPMLWQVSAFTVAHSITLGLRLYGVIELDPRIVEPLIALSIVYVAAENLWTSELKPWRVALVFAFGLLHGMGFAGVLRELALPRSEFLTGLAAFNIGVEAGQLAVILTAFVSIGLWTCRSDAYRRFVAIPGSMAIAATGLFWTIQRLGA